MGTKELALEKASVLQLINAELDIRRQRAGQPLTEHELKESSMLKSHEIIEGERIYRDLRRHYQDKLRQMGGVEGVINDLENYIIALLGNDESYRTNQEKRQHNPDDPLGIQQLKAALRVIKDDAPGSSFGNFLDPSSSGNIGATFNTTGSANGREMLAYFWLAAADPKMELDAKYEHQREQCLREEKMIVIASLCDIRRAHNDGVNTPVDDVKDDPSCGPGTWGRIAKMHVHNKRTKMHLFQNNVVKYKEHMPSFVIEQFKILSLDKQLEIINSMNDYFINRTKAPSKAPFATFGSFMLGLQNSQDKGTLFLQMISEEYGEGNRKELDENQQKYALLTYQEELRKMVKEINNDMFLRLQHIMIDNLTKKSNEVVRQQLEHDPNVKQARQRLSRIEIEIHTLQQQLESINDKIKYIDFTKTGAIQQIEKLKAQKEELDKRYVILMGEKELRNAEIEKISRVKIAVEMKRIMLDLMVAKTNQVDELLALDIPQETAVVHSVSQSTQASDADSRLPVEIAGITPTNIVKHPSYNQVRNMYINVQKRTPEEAERLARERVLTALIKTKNDKMKLSDETVAELSKLWLDHYGQKMVTQESVVDKPTVVKLAVSIPPVKIDKKEKEIYAKVDALPEREQISYAQHQAWIHDEKEIKISEFDIPVLVDFDKAIKRLNTIIKKSSSKQSKEAAVEAKLAIGIYYYNAAKVMTRDTALNKEKYEEYVKKAEICGINTSIHLDPKTIRKEGIDKAVINPAWLVRLKAKLEDIEESFKLNSAYVGRSINDTRYANMISQFNLFIETSDLSSLVSVEAALTRARDAYFDELEKNAPLQSLLHKYYQEMQQAQKDLTQKLEILIVAFSREWVAKGRKFHDSDRAFLLDLVSDSDEVERSIIPSLQDHFKKINERLAQLALLQFPHQLYQDTETAVKKDTATLIENFYQNIAQHVVLLEGRKPSKGTIAAKQLKVLKEALDDLKVQADALREQISTRELAGVALTHFHQVAQAAIEIANSLQNHTSKIGQAGGIKKATRSVKNGLRSAFSTVGFNVDAKATKELSTQELAEINLGMDSTTIDRQVFDIDYAKGIARELDAKRQPVISSFEKRRRQQRPPLLLTKEQSKLALDYILLHTDKPEEVNLLGYLKPGVSVSIIDLGINPLELQFEDLSSDAPPKRVRFEVSQLKDFADRQRNKIEERDNRLHARVYENYGILFRGYHTFGQVGTDQGRPERKEYVTKLHQLIEMDGSLLPLILNAQPSSGLLALSESLENASHMELLAHVQSVLFEKASQFRQTQFGVSREEWEGRTAVQNQKVLKDALETLLDLDLSSRQKI